MNSDPLMLRLADLKNAKEDLGKNCVALYEASSGDGSLNDDGHCGKSSTLSDSALPHKECPDDGFQHHIFGLSNIILVKKMRGK